MWFTILVLFTIGFTGYAMYKYFDKTDASAPTHKRVWAAVSAALAAAAGAVASWFGGAP